MHCASQAAGHVESKDSHVWQQLVAPTGVEDTSIRTRVVKAIDHIRNPEIRARLLLFMFRSGGDNGWCDNFGFEVLLNFGPCAANVRAQPASEDSSIRPDDHGLRC